MSRHNKQRSYGHRIQYFGTNTYRVSWVVDRYCAGSRLRYPTSYSRATNKAGAMRFAKKWKCKSFEIGGKTK